MPDVFEPNKALGRLMSIGFLKGYADYHSGELLKTVAWFEKEFPNFSAADIRSAVYQAITDLSNMIIAIRNFTYSKKADKVVISHGFQYAEDAKAMLFIAMMNVDSCDTAGLVMAFHHYRKVGQIISELGASVAGPDGKLADGG